MTVYRLRDELVFPPVDEAEPSGLLGVGADLSPERLLLAYSSGIFPWYESGGPVLWFSPDPRSVIEPGAVHVGRSLAKALRHCNYQLRMDSAFLRVIRACAWKRRRDQPGTWITADMIKAYCELHRLGFAHSIEVWQGEALVGGLYGVSIGTAFFGESMFSNAVNASKLALVWLCRQLDAWHFSFIDCQFQTDHLRGLGAAEITRPEFLRRLYEALGNPTRRGNWAFNYGLDVHCMGSREIGSEGPGVVARNSEVAKQ